MTSPSDSAAEPTRAGTACPGGPGLLAGRTVARVGYGAMQLRNLRHDRDAATALLRRAVELGVNHVDTAQFYGDGLVNDLIREAIGPDDGITVVSKVGADPGPGGPHPIRMAQRPGELAATVDANLASLGLGQIPVVNLRRPDASTPVPVADDQVVDLDDQLAALIALRDAGKIGAIGLSGVTLEELRRALPAGIACVQNDYSLVSRGHEDMLQLCAEAGIAWVPYFPLGGARPGSLKVTAQPAVLAAAESLGCTPAQAGLGWLLRHAPNILLIPGTASPGHLEENLAAGALTIDTATLAALDAVPSHAAA
jgi:pyridoxine 4-dehydrogenase